MPLPSSEATPGLRTYRVVSLLAAALAPVFGYLYHWNDPAAVDPLWMRWLVGVLPLALAAGSYVSAWVRAHLEVLAAAIVCVMVSWFGVVTALNDLAPEYVLGYLFVVVMISIATPETSTLPMAFGLALYTVGVAAAAVLAAGAPATNPWFFMVCVVCTAVTICIGLWLRHGVRQRAQASETLYRTVFESTTDGLSLTDAETGRFLEANSAYLTLTGYTLAELRALTIPDVVVAPERFTKHELDTALNDRQLAVGEQQHRRKDGTLVDLKVGVRLIERDGQAVFCTTAHDLTEQKRVDAEKARAQAQAETMLRMKSTILDTMGHELRTPLAGILGFTEILAEEVTDEQRDLAQAVQQNAHRLSDTLSALLDLAQLRSGEAKMHIEVVDVAEVAGEVADLFRHRTESKGLDFRAEIASPARAQLDREALHRLLSHLLSNAVKFTDEGAVRLTVGADEQRVVLRVIDTGIGMDAADVPALFDAFEQASTGLSRTHEGTGLGLPITKQLIDLLGGRVEVQSVPGAGTTFTVSFDRTWASVEDAPERPRPAARLAPSPGAPSPPAS
ncbi:MAG: ATP-binding protein [Bacteroidota bacterium]